MATEANDKGMPLNDLNTTPIEEPENGVFMAYANVVNMDWTLFYIRIRFGELMPAPDEDSPSWTNQHGIVPEKAAITMPWHPVKYLALTLDRIIRDYEEKNGELKPIKLPSL